MSHPVYGRTAVAEPPSSLGNMHLAAPGHKMRTVSHPPKLGVLDQSDLIAQGIDTSVIIPGAGTADALGSCTANSTMEHLSTILDEATFLALIKANIDLGYMDVKAGEIAAIRFYHACTDQTGETGQEWPPTDCGSSGLFCSQLSDRMGLTKGERVAHGADNIVSMMQGNSIIVGTPFMFSWESPPSNGFIDGNGTQTDLENAIQSGVAGGHETCWHTVAKLAFTTTGHVDPFKTVIVARNSWSKSWGDKGDYLFHLSTFIMLGNHCDYRQLQKKIA